MPTDRHRESDLHFVESFAEPHRHIQTQLVIIEIDAPAIVKKNSPN